MFDESLEYETIDLNSKINLTKSNFTKSINMTKSIP